jgi:methionine-rich copper-binding protein CopC
VKTFRIAAVCVMLGAVLSRPAPPAWGHAALVKSSPANGASLTKAPPVIRAWFSEELAVKGSTLRLFDAHQKQIAAGGVDTGVKKHDVMKIAPPHLAPGTYVVRWHAISADDNNVAQGSFRFTVGAGALAPRPPGASLPPLHLIAPANNPRLRNPVALIIETPGDISRLTLGGEMAGMSHMGSQVHLHVVVDNATFMPWAKQLTRVGSHRYRFQLPLLSSGTHTIKIYWGDNTTHRPAGAVQTAHCTIVG